MNQPRMVYDKDRHQQAERMVENCFILGLVTDEKAVVVCPVSS